MARDGTGDFVELVLLLHSEEAVMGYNVDVRGKFHHATLDSRNKKHILLLVA